MKQSIKEFTASINQDYRLYHEEIECSIAHTHMLVKEGMLSEEDAEKIVAALNDICTDIEEGKLNFTVEYGDVHGNIEAFLVDRVGAVGKRLKIARSVNDQVVTDTRLFLKKEVKEINNLITELLDTLEALAKEHVNTIIPGYSHMQRAQPVTLAYHLLAYYQMFKRDRKRFLNCLDAMDMLPPDGGAIAGTIYDTDRTLIMKELGFKSLMPNAMDAISDRDFAMEFANCGAITMMHLSRFCEDLILWDTVEFDFIEIADEFTTGSRLMPQKKNLDVAELIRGKSGRVYGNLMNLLTIFKGMPMAYNRDMQEDKEPVIDTANTVESCLYLFLEMIKTMKINRGEMQRAAKYGYMNAPEIGEYLFAKGVPIEECYDIIDRLVKYAVNNGKAIEELWLDDLKQFSHKFESDIYDTIAIRNIIATKKSAGSTSFDSVEKQLKDIAADKKKKR